MELEVAHRKLFQRHVTDQAEGVWMVFLNGRVAAGDQAHVSAGGRGVLLPNAGPKQGALDAGATEGVFARDGVLTDDASSPCSR
jgi:hypothetical protein